MATTQPIRDKEQVCQLTDYYLQRGQLRNHAMVILALYTALRISDLLRLRWEDVYDFDAQAVKPSISLSEQKTGKSKTIALHPAAADALLLLVPGNAAPGRFIIENPYTRRAISRIQAYRLIRAAGEALMFGERVSCHSLRKTFGYHALKSGVAPVVLMEIYNHSSLATTNRYLGITQDDKNEVYLGLSFADTSDTKARKARPLNHSHNPSPPVCSRRRRKCPRQSKKPLNRHSPKKRFIVSPTQVRQPVVIALQP